MTATFFNARFTKKTLVEGTRLMLSGEVGYFRGTMQLTHPAFLILEGAARARAPSHWRRSPTSSKTGDGELDLSAFERDFFPIYPASAKVQSWDIYACVRQVLDVLDPIEDPLPESVRRALGSDVGGRGAARHPPRRESEDRERAKDRLAFDEAVGLQWALVVRRNGELGETGPPAPARDGGLARRAARTVAVRAHRRSARRARGALDRTRRHQADAPDAAG